MNYDAEHIRNNQMNIFPLVLIGKKPLAYINIFKKMGSVDEVNLQKFVNIICEGMDIKAPKIMLKGIQEIKSGGSIRHGKYTRGSHQIIIPKHTRAMELVSMSKILIQTVNCLLQAIDYHHYKFTSTSRTSGFIKREDSLLRFLKLRG